MFQEKLIIASNEKITNHFKLLRLELPPKVDESRIGKEAKPGQFVQLRLHDGTAPLLRRPFTFYKARLRFVEILYKTVGEGTKLMNRLHEGDLVDIVGPLGNGFEIVPDVVDIP